MRRLKAAMWGLLFLTLGVGVSIWGYHDHRVASGLAERGKITTGTVEKASRVAYEKVNRKTKLQVHYYPVAYDDLTSEIRIEGREVAAGTQLQVIYDPADAKSVQPYRPELTAGWGAWDWLWRIGILCGLALVSTMCFRDAFGPPLPPTGHGA